MPKENNDPVFIHVLDLFSFIKVANGNFSIPDKIKLYIPASVLSDLAYLAFMRRMEVDLLIYDLKNLFEFQELNDDIFYNQYYIKTQLEPPTKRIRDNYLLPFALAIQHQAKIYTSEYMKKRLFAIGEDMDIVTI